MENRYVYVKEVDDVNHDVYFKIFDSEKNKIFTDYNLKLKHFESEDDFSNQCDAFDNLFTIRCYSLNKGELVVDNKKDDMEAVNTEITKYKVGDKVKIVIDNIFFNKGSVGKLVYLTNDNVFWLCSVGDLEFYLKESEFEPINGEDIEYKVDNNELVLNKKDMSNKGGCIVDLDFNKDKKTINDFIEKNYYGDKDNPYEAIKIINNLNLNFNRGNVLKYILRAGKKNEDKEIEDLIKAKNYIDYEIERLKIMNEH